MLKKYIKGLFQFFGISVRRYIPPSYGWIYARNITAVLDIGANTGQYALAISKILPESKIYSFEPIKKCYDDLIINTEKLNIETFNFALGENEYETEINVSSHSPSSSLLRMTDLHKKLYSHTKNFTVEKISVKALDQIAHDLNISKENYLVKIDAQGFEDKIIKGGYNTIKNAQIIQVEMTYQELYEGQPLFDNIYQVLNEMGFDFSGNISQVYNPDTGELVYSDSIFLRTQLK